ncbi:hypothetical protein CsSME_00024821 [Camellia sinensis var. sinensis]
MANNDEFPLSAIDEATPEYTRRREGPPAVHPMADLGRPLEDSQETRGISAEGVMVIHGVQTVTGGGETRTLGDWKTS